MFLQFGGYSLLDDEFKMLCAGGVGLGIVLVLVKATLRAELLLQGCLGVCLRGLRRIGQGGLCILSATEMRMKDVCYESHAAKTCCTSVGFEDEEPMAERYRRSLKCMGGLRGGRCAPQ